MTNKKHNNFNIVSTWGTLSTSPNQRTGGEIKVLLTKTSHFGKDPMWDIRNWDGGIAGQGVIIGHDDDLRKLRDMLISVCDQIERRS